MSEPTSVDWWLTSLQTMLADLGARDIVLVDSSDLVTELSCTSVRSDLPVPRKPAELVVKIPRTPEGARVVEREIAVLRSAARVLPESVRSTLPRIVTTPRLHVRRVLVTTRMTGTRLHRPVGPPTRWRALRDYQRARAWMEAVQATVTGAAEPVEWPARLSGPLAARWDGHDQVASAASRVERAAVRLLSESSPHTVVHGRLGPESLWVDGTAVTGVQDWADGDVCGDPLRDLVQFALGYSAFRRPGRRAPRGNGRTGGRVADNPLVGVRSALLGTDWYADLFRAYLQAGLARLQVSAACWYDLAVAGVAERCLRAEDEEVAEAYLSLLADLP